VELAEQLVELAELFTDVAADFAADITADIAADIAGKTELEARVKI
jgi:hypothetical protein